jgi:hypothetical protein
MRKATQPVLILHPPGKLNHFERTAKVHVQALFFGFAIQGSGAVEDRIGRVGQRAVLFIA